MKRTEKDIIPILSIGISKAQMYSPEHEAVEAAAGKVGSILEELEAEHLSILIVDDELVINNVLFRESGLHGKKFMRMFKLKGLSRVDFLKGVKPEETRKFIADVADAEKELGQYVNIRAGVMGVRTAASGVPVHLDLSAFSEEQLGRVEALFGTVSPFRELEVAGLDEIVANFLITFRRGANILRMISPVRSHSEFTYTHAMNVAVLSMSQAEYLCLKDDLVHEVGIAALMHDVGKLFITEKVLHKDQRLTEDEYADVKRHSLLGAAYLLRTDGLPRLASIVALEHHRKFDGSGYPVLSDNGRRQHVASQIVAISDFFDALRSHRPYRRSLSVEEILQMMRDGSGTSFNPVLLNNFTMITLNAL